MGWEIAVCHYSSLRASFQILDYPKVNHSVIWRIINKNQLYTHRSISPKACLTPNNSSSIYILRLCTLVRWDAILHVLCCLNPVALRELLKGACGDQSGSEYLLLVQAYRREAFCLPSFSEPSNQHSPHLAGSCGPKRKNGTLRGRWHFSLKETFKQNALGWPWWSVPLLTIPCGHVVKLCALSMAWLWWNKNSRDHPYKRLGPVLFPRGRKGGITRPLKDTLFRGGRED